MTISPGTGLAGGQELHVSIAGFPRHATVMIYECAGLPPPAGNTHGCAAGDSSISYLGTGRAGTASGQFIAQPSAGSGRDGSQIPCHRQCVLVGVVIKLGHGVPPTPAPMATAPLSFSATAAPGLADAFLMDLSWVSATEGWALAVQPCTTGTCARMAHTTDGGAHWHPLPSPPAQLQGATGCAKVACVNSVRFASPTVGYLYGPALLMTTDGGRSWHVQPGRSVETLTVADGNVYRIAYDHGGCPGPCQPILQEASIGSTAWRTLAGPLADAGGDAAQIAGSGSALLVAMYGDMAAGAGSAQAAVYRSTDRGASWQPATDPCTGPGAGRQTEYDLTDLAAAPGGFFAGLCSSRAGTGAFVVTSPDSGRSWQTAGTVPAVLGPGLLAAASPTILTVSTGAIGGRGAVTARVLVSTDGGRHWDTAATDRQQLTQAGIPAWLGFETSRAGWWIGDPHSVWTTRDGGRHWVQTAFR